MDIISKEVPRYLPYKVNADVPAKWNNCHQEQLCEPTSLACTTAPTLKYTPKILLDYLDLTRLDSKLQSPLSGPQVEFLMSCCQRLEQPKVNGQQPGFLNGDGTGVGKTREMAAVFWELYVAKGLTKALWVSSSTVLADGAKHELDFIGKICGETSNFFLNDKSVENGCKTGFSATEIVSRRSQRQNKLESANEGVIFTAYTGLSCRGKGQGIKKCITKFLGPQFNGLIILDECHLSKNASDYMTKNKKKHATNVGKNVQLLHALYPSAKFIYSSATACSEPIHLVFMHRLTLWGKGCIFKNVEQFKNVTIENKSNKLSAIEFLMMYLKINGSFLSRHLQPVKDWKIETHDLTPQEIQLYNDCALMWQTILKFMRTLPKKSQAVKMSCYWSCHQRFFASLLVSLKLAFLDTLEENFPSSEFSVVVSLTHTGESALKKENDSCLNDSSLSSCTRIDLKKMFEHIGIKVLSFDMGNMPNSIYSSSSDEEQEQTAITDENEPSKKRLRIQQELETNSSWSGKSSSSSDGSNTDSDTESDSSSSGSTSETSSSLCSDTSSYKSKKSNEGRISGDDKNDDKPCSVEEWTAPETICGQLVQLHKDLNIDRELLEDLLTQYTALEMRLPETPLESIIKKFGGKEKVAEITGRAYRIICGQPQRDAINTKLEMEKFQSENVKYAVISDKGSTGINLHAEVTNERLNPKQRLQICAELPWSAEKTLQSLGRTHRSGQKMPPIHRILTTNVPGELRFVISCIQRLSDMAAITKGDRHAVAFTLESCLGIDDNLSKKMCKIVLQDFVKCNKGQDMEAHYAEAKKVGLFESLKSNKVWELSKVYNRLMGMKFESQQYFHQLFSLRTESAIYEAKKDGTFDYGLRKMTSLWGYTSGEEQEFKFPIGNVVLVKMIVDKGLSWRVLQSKVRKEDTQNVAFFCKKLANSNNNQIICALKKDKTDKTPLSYDTLLWVYSPYDIDGKIVTLREILEDEWRRFEEDKSGDAERRWNQMFMESNHLVAEDYEDNVRCFTKYLLIGSVIIVWKSLTNVLQEATHAVTLSLKRINSETSKHTAKNVVGVLIPNKNVPELQQGIKEQLDAANEREMEDDDDDGDSNDDVDTEQEQEDQRKMNEKDIIEDEFETDFSEDEEN